MGIFYRDRGRSNLAVSMMTHEGALRDLYVDLIDPLPTYLFILWPAFDDVHTHRENVFTLYFLSLLHSNVLHYHLGLHRCNNICHDCNQKKEGQRVGNLCRTMRSACIVSQCATFTDSHCPHSTYPLGKSHLVTFSLAAVGQWK